MIDSIYIKNFKSIKEITIKCNARFNVIIGENNIGKTTIFEAIHLWKICYEANVQKRNKTMFYALPKNINFADNEYLRAFEDKDLLNNELYSTNKDIIISVNLKYEEKIYKLGFQITKVKGLDNAYFQITYVDKEEFLELSRMVKGTDYNLNTILTICESRPVANIIAKEPYMYKPQVRDKLSRGKVYEVLRNKIIKSQNINIVENHISNVMGKPIVFSEVDKDNKTYIRLMVNNANILSQGSGFLQIAEIFSSIEYVGAMNVVLIDEPDSHLHMLLQKKLIDELRQIDNSQVFIITHNERFIDYISDEEILYIDEQRKSDGMISHLKKGYKNLILKGLIGTLDRISELRNARTIVLLEGDTDVNFIDEILKKYSELANICLPCIYIEKLYGIDTLDDKLLSYSRAYAELVEDDARWIIIRDSDCLPLHMHSKSAKRSKKYITAEKKEILFQKGYGIESTFISETKKLADILIKYYELSEEELDIVKNIIINLKEEYSQNITNVKSTLYDSLKSHFIRQQKNRIEYKDLNYDDMLKCIDKNNIEYIMTKNIANEFYRKIHDKLVALNYRLPNESLNNNTIANFYLYNLNSLDDFYECHLLMIRKIIGDDDL